MSNIRSALKAAKSALDAQNYDEAIKQAREILALDSRNYFAGLFLGRALEKQGNSADAEGAYTAATKIKPDEELAWKGLCSALESQGSRKVKKHTSACLSLAQIYAEASDKHQCQDIVDKAVDFARKHGSYDDYRDALTTILPSSPLFDFLEGRISHPSQTYMKLAELTETEEKALINREIGERRTRLGSKIDQVTTDVKREVFRSSTLEDLYQNVINWTRNDETRRSYEEKLLQRGYDLLTVLYYEEKHSKGEEVIRLARDMVIIKHPFHLAWEIDLEWKDLSNFEEMDTGVLEEYMDFFPEKGLSKVLSAYFGKERISAAEVHDVSNGCIGDVNDVKVMTMEERLLLLVDGLDESKDSALAHRITGEFFLRIGEYESSADASRRGLRLLNIESKKSGLPLQKNIDAVNTNLATSLVYYQSPKNHPEARILFEDVLNRIPNSTAALLGIGLIHEEQEEYEKAFDFLDRASRRDPLSISITAEAAWCNALSGNTEPGLATLEDCLTRIEVVDAKSRELKAQTLYRVGKCLWDVHTDKESRRSRQGPYARYLSAIKANPNYAPAYTALGIYYADYSKDKRRARQCFQKAFELSFTEVTAAERLARDFANDGDWDIVEIVAQRVIDSGTAKPSPGSRKKGLSWPFAALGIAQMGKLEFARSVVSFQVALRITPGDYHSWVGLGESYYSSGRYNAALRTLEFAENMTSIDSAKQISKEWFARYMLANIHRELGNFDEALKEYDHVLDSMENEFGVSIAKLQTLVEKSWYSLENGFFGRAARSASSAILMSKQIYEHQPEAFNLWKAVGDACSIFYWVQSRACELPHAEAIALLQSTEATEEYQSLFELDGINMDSLPSITLSNDLLPKDRLYNCLIYSVLAHKRAIQAAKADPYSRAVAWYNLGWIEYKIHTHCKGFGESIKATTFGKAAVQSFKRAIELESGNAEFWNALGTATTTLSPKVAQHSFIRSLYLNERSARTWTNLGVLYLMQNEHDLAHSAFARAQSTDPDYGLAWVGEGLIALLLDDLKEALSHFTHAFEISESTSAPAKIHFSGSTFDHLISSSITSHNLTDLVEPIFALQQLQTQRVSLDPYRHLLALLQERVGDFNSAMNTLIEVCETAERSYEETESAIDLARFARAKSDLARNELAAGLYREASENAMTALDLSTEENPDASGWQNLTSLQLSAHLTNGLARYHLGDMSQAVQAFRAALHESGSAADVVCLLAQVLWEKNGEEDRNVARDQLLNCIEKNIGHFGATSLLGAIAGLDEDEAIQEAVEADLQSLRVSDDLDQAQRRQVERILAAFTGLTGHEGQRNEDRLTDTATSILLEPSMPHGWSTLAELGSDPYASQMTFQNASRAVPPNGLLEATDLAVAFARAGTAGHAQRSILICPWQQSCWEALKAVLG